MNIDRIVQAPFNFHLLNSDCKKIWKYHLVLKGDTLIVLGELDLTNASAEAHHTYCVAMPGGVAGAAGARFAGAVEMASTEFAFASDTMVDTFVGRCNKAREEFEKSGKVAGFELLNIRTFKQLWISRLEYSDLLQYSINLH